MPNIIDARGRSCPEPVIMTKNALDSNPNTSLKVLVDTNVAVENIKRFASSKGYNVRVNKNNDEFQIQISK
ncbi:sulfurtransferase TusA family protein [Paratissierella segnis]|jgi:TusA-related sulfurtransferase|uniref:Sulfurtransferase TusA family protein n=1 Tax=Paratissierella segnis TaxID=2763679 RepID=A0A926EV50_9FIRM|nr:sulfurtransferase TusA family protein [Paratissierella segnis]MBC8588201.1 sulfurtransferase TusA family protein [Paratissierella segnis]